MEIINSVMEIENSEKLKYKRAEKKVKALKGFYVHFGIYILINLFISINKVIVYHYDNGQSWIEAFWQFETFSVWIFWGIGIVFHAAKAFDFNPFFSKNWEKRQIEKYINEDKDGFKKFK